MAPPLPELHRGQRRVVSRSGCGTPGGSARVRFASGALLALGAAAASAAWWPSLPGWACLRTAGLHAQEVRTAHASSRLAFAPQRLVARGAPTGIARRAHVAGEFGVLPESPAPLIDTSHEEDPLLERLVGAVQAADGRRGVDISAFWIKEGSEIVVIITALSRPQLQAIAGDIDLKMRKGLRLKRQRNVYFTGHGIREEAATGWCCMVYPRITIHVMTPTQRSYYDIESTWRDDNQDYEKIPVDELIREDGFGNMRLSRELENREEADYADTEEEEEEQGVKVGAGVEYEEDEEDPFWS